MQDYYDILGVTDKSSNKEIKTKFRKLTLQHHPDRGGDPEIFNRVVTAYKYIMSVNNTVEDMKLQANSTDEFFKKMFGSKYGPYSRK